MIAVSFHPASNEELLEATTWYLARSHAAAAGFVREVDHAVMRIAEAPRDIL
jgi:plasmid stabilization system protein ParE